MRFETRATLIALPIGIALGVLVISLGLPGLIITVALYVAFFAYCTLASRVAVASRMRRAVRRLVDPTSGPPAHARPVESPFPARLQARIDARDWDAVRALLADDFTLVDPKGRRYGKSVYFKFLRSNRRVFPDLREEIETVVAVPEDPHVLWVRTTQVGHPRRGPAWDVTAWERLTLTPEQRLREAATVGVVRAA